MAEGPYDEYSERVRAKRFELQDDGNEHAQAPFALLSATVAPKVLHRA